MVWTSSQVDQLVLRLCCTKFVWFIPLRFNWGFRLVPLVWHGINSISAFGFFSRLELTLISRRVLFGWVVVRVKVFALPICSHKPTSLFEICCKVNMLFFAKYFSFDTWAGLGPLIQNLLSFFVSPFLLKFSILVFKPHSFKLLFSYVVCGVVMEVWRTAFESVLSFKFNWLLSASSLASCVEGIEWFSSDSLFWLVKRWHVRSSCHRFIISKSSTRHVEGISDMREH